jgi:hypothetical protein
MSTSLIQLEPLPTQPQFALTQAQTMLRQMVLDSVNPSTRNANTRRRSMICSRSVAADLSPVHC